MSIQKPQHLLDVRSLSRTREVIAYKDGGLFPVLALAQDGTVVAILRGGAGHLGIEGRLEVVRSRDDGLTWTPPNVVVDSEVDDRNPAFGVSHRGTLILAYARCSNYDSDKNWIREDRTVGKDCAWEMMVTRSLDAGLTWEKPFPLGADLPGAVSPYGKIVPQEDRTLLLPIYCYANEALRSLVGKEVDLGLPGNSCVFVLRSRDDGRTWGEPSLLAPTMNETALVTTGTSEVLAVMRDDGGAALHSTRSSDGGHTWSEPTQITADGQHPADMVLLHDGSVLLTYGNRNPPYRIEGLISRDGGRSWVDCMLTFSGHLYGCTVDAPRRTDLGYPSSVVRRGSGAGRGVTMYYYNPSLREPSSRERRRGEPIYRTGDYYAIAVAWDEVELTSALDRAVDQG